MNIRFCCEPIKLPYKILKFSKMFIYEVGHKYHRTKSEFKSWKFYTGFDAP